jgi:hypothetical protein
VEVMSKPRPIEYELQRWYIQWSKDNKKPFEAGVLWRPPEQDFRYDNTQNKYFETYEEAKAWIDKEIADA